MDYYEKIGDDIINKNYEQKLKLNDSYENLKSKYEMVNLENVILEKYLIDNELFFSYLYINDYNNVNKYSSIYYTFSNKILNKIQKEDQLFLSYFKRRFIPLSLLKYYIYLIKEIIIEDNKKEKNKYFNSIFKRKYGEELMNFINIHDSNIIFKNIEGYYFLNKNNLSYASNYTIKKMLNQKKINFEIYE